MQHCFYHTLYTSGSTGSRQGLSVKTETIQMMAGAAVLSAFTYMPILAATPEFGASEFVISIIVGAYAAASFIASYIFGRAGDIYGRRLILRSGLLLAVLTFGLLVITDSLVMLFIVRILNGFSIGMYPGALAAYAYESDMKMGRFASFGALGWGVGTLLAGFAAGYNIYYAFLVSTVFLAVAFASALTLPSIDLVRVKVPLFPVETLKRNAGVYLAMLIRHSSAFALWTLWAPFLISIGADTAQIGIVQAANSLAQVFFMVTIIDMFHYRRLIISGLVTTAVAFAYFTVVAMYFNWIQILPSQILLGFSWSCLYVGALKYVTEKNEEKSTASGLLTSVMAISGIIGPIIAAIVRLYTTSYLPIMVFGVIMSFVALLIFEFVNRRNGEVKTTSPDLTN
ncbi:MAG: MFS transporter [Candidatus Thorarchaeota archaeon]